MKGNPSVRSPRHAVAERPFIVIWESTRACPLACLHCRATARPDRDPHELSGAQARALMRQTAEFGRPSPLFVITGGDPFQRHDLTDLIAYGTSLGLRIAVSPSGTPTLNRANLTAVREAGAVALSLSLDGSTAERHDAFRGVDGVFAWTLAGWRTAHDIGLKVQINTTLTRHSLRDLADIAALVRREGAMLWSGFLLVPTGRGTQLDGLTPQEVEDAMHFLYDCGVVIATKTTEGHHFRRVAVQRAIHAERGTRPELGPLYAELTDRAAELGLFEGQLRPRRRPPMDVSSARGFVFVSHTGEVHPSGFLPVSAGNVKHASLPDIYRTGDLFVSLRDPGRLRGKCGECEFSQVCGGSRSRALAVTGDMFAEDPYCAYRAGLLPPPGRAAGSARTGLLPKWNLMRSVTVIGAGISGLTAAWALRDTARVTVLDSAPRVGGKIRTGPCRRRPRGPGRGVHGDAGPRCRPSGAGRRPGRRTVRARPAPVTIWTRGALRPMPAGHLMGIPTDPDALAGTGLLSDEAAARLRLDETLPAKPQADDVSVAEYLGGRLGQVAVDRLGSRYSAGCTRAAPTGSRCGPCSRAWRRSPSGASRCSPRCGRCGRSPGPPPRARGARSPGARAPFPYGACAAATAGSRMPWPRRAAPGS